MNGFNRRKFELGRIFKYSVSIKFIIVKNIEWAGSFYYQFFIPF